MKRWFLGLCFVLPTCVYPVYSCKQVRAILPNGDTVWAPVINQTIPRIIPVKDGYKLDYTEKFPYRNQTEIIYESGEKPVQYHKNYFKKPSELGVKR